MDLDLNEPDWKRTNTQYVWVNRKIGAYTYSDECEQFGGLYDSEYEAKVALDKYVSEFLN